MDCLFCGENQSSEVAHRQCIEQMYMRWVNGMCKICGKKKRALPDTNCEECTDEMPYWGFERGSGPLVHSRNTWIDVDGHAVTPP